MTMMTTMTMTMMTTAMATTTILAARVCQRKDDAVLLAKVGVAGEKSGLGFWFGRRLILRSQDTPPGRAPRSMQRARDGNVSPLLSDGSTNPATYRATLTKIHTDSVSRVVNDPNFSHSHVLGGNRPNISPSESSLSRAERSTQVQLRSGQSHLL